MPIEAFGPQQIDYLTEGSGETVVLVHSSVSGNRQWRSLIDDLKDRYRVVAPNLFGYGETTAWHGPGQQTLADQAELVASFCAGVNGPVHLVGHSFGGAVALKAATMMGNQVAKLVLFEPMLGYLLLHHDRTEAYHEAKTLADHVTGCAAVGEWSVAAEKFADYWLGDGAWAGMPEKRREAFIVALKPTVHEFVAMLGEASTTEIHAVLPAKTMVMHALNPRRTIREIVELLERDCPHWTHRQIDGGGHMAPLTTPELVNPVIRTFLDL